MGNMLFGNIQMVKMSFTDLIPILLGSSGSTFSLQNVKDFFKNQKPSASALTSFQKFQDQFQSVDFLLGQVRNPVVQMFLNPDTIKINKKVLLDKKQTRGGFVVQFWGHDLEEITVNAATAYFDLSKEPLAAFELLKRQCYQGRYSDTQPFRGSPIIAMLFESQILKGYFTNFDYSIVSTEPFFFKYSFGFTVTENLTFAVSSNLSNTVATAIDVVKKGSFSVTQNRSDVDLVPESLQFGKGWGVQLF